MIQGTWLTMLCFSISCHRVGPLINQADRSKSWVKDQKLRVSVCRSSIKASRAMSSRTGNRSSTKPSRRFRWPHKVNSTLSRSTLLSLAYSLTLTTRVMTSIKLRQSLQTYHLKCLVISSHQSVYNPQLSSTRSHPSSSIRFLMLRLTHQLAL
jgi:hypothetical protein